MSNLANLLHDMGQFEEAETMFLTAIEVTERALGKDHPRVSAPLYGLGNLYRDQARWESAKESLLRSLQINLKKLPKNHPYTAADLGALVEVHIKLNQPILAKKYLAHLNNMTIDDPDLVAQISTWQQQLDSIQ